MAGDTANARQWNNANVYVTTNMAAVRPTNVATAFNADWGLVGLLDGEAGMIESRSVDLTQLFAWGGLVVRQSRTNFVFTMQFTPLESNEEVFDLVYPGSTYGVDIRVPTVVPTKVAFELLDSVAGDTLRMITANYAEIDLNGDLTRNDSDLQKYPLTATIIPDAGVDPARLFWTQQQELAS